MPNILKDNPFPKSLSKADIKRFLDTGKIRSNHETKIKIYNTKDIIIIYCVTEDKPFTIETLIATCEKYGFFDFKIYHSVKTVIRDQKNAIKSIKRKTNQNFESFIKCSLSKHDPTKKQMIDLFLEQITMNFKLLDKIVKEWPDMMQIMTNILHSFRRMASIEHKYYESLGFIKWILEDRFTYIGYQKIIDDNKFAKLFGYCGINKIKCLADNLKSTKPIVIYKSQNISPIREIIPMDIIVVNCINIYGKNEKHVFYGLFTTAALKQGHRNIPYLKSKVEKAAKKLSIELYQHEYKNFLDMVDKIPTRDLFVIGHNEIANFYKKKKASKDNFYFHFYPIYNSIYSIIIFSKNKDSLALQKCVEIIDKKKNWSILYQNQTITKTVSSFQFLIYSESEIKNISKTKLLLKSALKTWDEKFQDILFSKKLEEKEINKIFFDSDYKLTFAYLTGYIDYKFSQNAFLNMTPYFHIYISNGETKIKVYNPNNPINLSKCLGIFTNFGITIYIQKVYKIQTKDGICFIHDFSIQKNIKNINNTVYIEKMFSFVWQGIIENNILCKLVFTIKTNVLNIFLLNAYVDYLKQKTGLSSEYICDVISKYPNQTAKWLHTFDKKFNPNNKSSDFFKPNNQLAEITINDHYFIFENFFILLYSTVRTNYYNICQTKFGHDNYLVFKLQSDINDILFETFIYHVDFIAIHMRTGKISRGGIRWSDRKHDLREEIKDLALSQNIKNTVIAPKGAKGGFVIKKEISPNISGKQAYEIMVRGLLDITDNWTVSKIIKPNNVICFDDDDYYLAIAADKGTSKFLDIANQISKQYTFWLKDAFASGGITGYNHKEMGITSKGAFESALNYFKILNINLDKEKIIAVGIGDMSGDVFGNGMILHQNILLTAAFNHKYIFIDPTPNPKQSYVERKRLFENELDFKYYNPDCISKGGGIFEVSQSQIKISSQIKKLLQIDKQYISGNDLICKILSANVDMIWMGGIGTFIKEDSSNIEFNKKFISANDVSAKMIIEGANLGVSNDSRHILSQKGCKINTDYIDNSGGVTCSDFEVNIKIALLNINPKSVDIEMQKAKKEVEKKVLMINKSQNKILNILEKDIEKRPKRYCEVLHMSEIKKPVENITRPDLCYILGISKMIFKKNLNEQFANIKIDKKVLSNFFISYFPSNIIQKFKQNILKHPLKKEILINMITNDIINNAGVNVIVSDVHKIVLNYIKHKKEISKIKTEKITEYKAFRQIESIILDLG